MKVDNAIIMAAGTSSRFAPLSYEKPKALTEVKGDVLIERQIKQLKESDIDEIVIVTGYKTEQFDYLKDKYGVILVHNKDYLTRNNNSSIYVAKSYLKNSYICSSDNYFNENPFEPYVDHSYYASVYVEGETDEWCIEETDGLITDVKIGGHDSWIMMGHVFWSSDFSAKFLKILENIYRDPNTYNKLWESIYIENLDKLNLFIRKYPNNYIFEFDSLDELRNFDESYKTNTRSSIMKRIANHLNINEEVISEIKSIKGDNNSAEGFIFKVNSNHKYRYLYNQGQIEVL